MSFPPCSVGQPWPQLTSSCSSFQTPACTLWQLYSEKPLVYTKYFPSSIESQISLKWTVTFPLLSLNFTRFGLNSQLLKLELSSAVAGLSKMPVRSLPSVSSRHLPQAHRGPWSFPLDFPNSSTAYSACLCADSLLVTEPHTPRSINTANHLCAFYLT